MGCQASSKESLQMDLMLPAHLPWYAAEHQGEVKFSSLLVANRLRLGSGPPQAHKEGTEPAALWGGGCGAGIGVQLRVWRVTGVSLHQQVPLTKNRLEAS